MKSACPGCGQVQDDGGLPMAGFPGASPACWNQYVALLDWLAQRPGRDALRQDAVAAYSAQHPASRELRDRRRVGLHLIGLYLALEAASPAVLRPAQYSRLAGKDFDWPALEPPDFSGTLSARALVASAPEGREALADAWIRQVWDAWSFRHGAVRAWWESLGA